MVNLKYFNVQYFHRVILLKYQDYVVKLVLIKPKEFNRIRLYHTKLHGSNEFQNAISDYYHCLIQLICEAQIDLDETRLLRLPQLSGQPPHSDSIQVFDHPFECFSLFP